MSGRTENVDIQLCPAACIGSREPCTSVGRAYVPISEPEELCSRHGGGSMKARTHVHDAEHCAENAF